MKIINEDLEQSYPQYLIQFNNGIWVYLENLEESFNKADILKELNRLYQNNGGYERDYHAIVYKFEDKDAFDWYKSHDELPASVQEVDRFYLTKD